MELDTQSLDRVLVVDKPIGISSFDVIRRLRRSLRIRKMGHAGTLDPAASGVLLICTGWATKLVPFLTDEEKSYRAVLRFGVETDTHDAEGTVMRTQELKAIDEALLSQTVSAFRGDIMQVPPRHSAIHVQGRRAYDLARAGEDFELDARPATVRSLDVLRIDGVDVEIDVTVSKGTYIRSLARDIGRAYGSGAHLASLRRTRSGRFDLSRSVQVEDFERETDPLSVCDVGYTPGEALALVLPTIELDEENAYRFGHGLPRWLSDDVALGFVRVVSHDGSFLGVGEVVDDGEQRTLRARRVYVASKRNTK